MIDEILKNTETKLEEVDGIVVAHGPGSFTGLRIGTTIAKGFGLALDKPLINIPTVDGLAYQIYGFEGLICPLMDARRNQVYTGLYTFEKVADDSSSKIAKEQSTDNLSPRVVKEQSADNLSFRVVKRQSALSIDDVIKELNNQNKHVIFLGDGVPVHQEQLIREIEVPLFFAPTFLNRQNAAAIGALGIRYLKEGKTKTALEYRPEYLRFAQAERERLELVESSKIEIRNTEPEDIVTILELERQNFTDPWSIANITETINQPYTLCLSAMLAGKVVGYLFASMIEDGEILAISVSDEMKRQGIGKRLLEKLIGISLEKGISRLILDVRKSNTGAICFYERVGFVVDGIRRGYYSNPKEDGVLMSLKLI
jgi:tRNA threonylcarbamoyl adenosine modification protein YeaZ/ribosomal-protein-alanine acetyltransferase